MDTNFDREVITREVLAALAGLVADRFSRGYQTTAALAATDEGSEMVFNACVEEVERANPYGGRRAFDVECLSPDQMRAVALEVYQYVE